MDEDPFLDCVMNFVRAASFLRGSTARLETKYRVENYHLQADQQAKLIGSFDRALTRLRKASQKRISENTSAEAKRGEGD